ncbi:hypothetical protein [Mycolicibacterium fallax]|uniref:Uncharacterized protein n=1 Tax=Mycolicibacterium fallax TaxID=1793 RepID=A0A1X1RMH2_MYCFA|nr:hypothetical protein [Mycolicibacterium fallax]ORV09681.1 hypothetical protein AWC04_01310 [Mycolicibacterium fallax]
MRLIDPETKISVGSRRISDRLPAVLAAVPLYTKAGRTCLLALDFDAKPHGRAQVDADTATAASWLTAAGARIITDHSTSGGRHILVPLAVGTTASFTEIRTLMRALAACLPSLDIAPNLNAATGAISVPGTACAGGGYRQLDGPLSDALDALTVGSDPALLPTLYATLGALPPPRRTAAPTTDTAPPTLTGPATTGSGDDLRLAPQFTWRHRPIPADVVAFAADGTLHRGGRWESPSEARHAVITHAVLRGASITAIRTLLSTDPTWAGIAASYQTKAAERAGLQVSALIRRDVIAALTWATANLAPKPNQPGHGDTYTHPPEVVRAWLAHALGWADRELARTRFRWVARDLLQALAMKAWVAGDLTGVSPVVGVGGRSLSLSAGLLSETTTFDALQRLREMPGAPILLIRPAVGREADHYALVTACPEPVTPRPAHLVQVADVHPAWSVLGRHNRAVHDAIVLHGLTDPRDVYAAARVEQRSGQLAVADLQTAGLITRRGRQLAPGPITLDDIAAAHHLDEDLAARIHRHRAERADWHEWLAVRHQLRDSEPATSESENCPTAVVNAAEHADYLAAVLNRGPPPADDEAESLHLLTDLLGAKIVATQQLATIQ